MIISLRSIHSGTDHQEKITFGGNHPCFDPEKDLVLPAWKQPDPGSLRLKLWSRPRKERTKFFYFNENLGPAYEKGRPAAALKSEFFTTKPLACDPSTLSANISS
ncbi:Exostosin family protein [Thalictrum thalictroides]|uniref:Exostosin family protein n=1 Tax=Thalictrum thalictroides TaxID=46969 RepID=A0A7J6VML3_THATH|nr:Exostosin family protein [Thalictrum thalictroides]